MSRRFLKFLTLAVVWIVVGMNTAPEVSAQASEDYVKEHYTKTEHRIKMRDGVELHTVVYTPKEPGNYPILMQRTPYSAGPYGDGTAKSSLGPSKTLMDDKYIFVYQDVRGRWMSGGLYDNMRPTVPYR